MGVDSVVVVAVAVVPRLLGLDEEEEEAGAVLLYRMRPVEGVIPGVCARRGTKMPVAEDDDDGWWWMFVRFRSMGPLG